MKIIRILKQTKFKNNKYSTISIVVLFVQKNQITKNKKCKNKKKLLKLFINEIFNPPKKKKEINLLTTKNIITKNKTLKILDKSSKKLGKNNLVAESIQK